ncbi:MAG TPA: formimidoylglutamate deiminase [Rubrobacteraceae bacterium]|nr:formimidoylglutamate deiminase [Rubrobacteraceae bacterium]
MRHTLLPDLLLDARGARSNVAVTVEGGRVVEVGPATGGERLPGRAFAPGFVNAHSHAFQRALRGRVERRDPDHPEDDFWTWRERMYALAESLGPDTIREASERCYREMLSAGYTSAAEFHYVHHRPDGTPHEDPNALAKAVAEAAGEAEIRLLMLPAAYARGGIPRFRDAAVDDFLGRVDELRAWAQGRPLVEVGVAAHSVRAVPRDWLEGLSRYARRNALPIHAHADEQLREIQDCREEYGMRPIELLAETGFLGSATTVVHATHANERELGLLAERGSSVCACPTTEGNLGDGFLPAQSILRLAIGLQVGSDSQVRIDPFEELREIETNARRLAGRRNVLVGPGEDSPVPWLLRAGWGRGEVQAGDPADFVEIDLGHPAVAGVEAGDLPSALVFGADSGVVAATWVAGRCVYAREDG